MKYTVAIDGNEMEVNGIEFGMLDGNPEGNIDLYLRVFDSEEDIYTDASKRTVWIDWLNNCLGTTRDPAERIKPVVAKVYGGSGDQECYRTIRIQHACIASFVESAGADEFHYEVTIKRAPRRAQENLVEVQAE